MPSPVLALARIAPERVARRTGAGPNLDVVVQRELVGVGAEAQGVRRIYLDSRFTAKGFYEKIGFTMHTSIPCWIDVDNATLRPGTEESAAQ